MAVSRPLAKSRTTMRGLASSRSSRIRCPARATTERIITPGPIGHEIAPVLASRIVPGRRHDLEVLGTVGVGEKDQLLSMVLHLILQPRAAGLHEPGDAVGFVARQKPDLGRLVVARLDQHVGLGLRGADLDEEAGVLLLVDDAVRRRILSEAVAPHPDGTMVLVELDIIECRRIALPDDASRGSRHLVRPVGPGGEVPHPQGVVFRALQVASPGHEPVVRRVGGATEVEEGVALRLMVAIQHHLLRAVPGQAADEGMLPALAIAREIGEGTIGLRHGGIVLLDPPPHLGDEGLPERVLSLEGRVGIRILLRQKGPDVAPEACLDP